MDAVTPRFLLRPREGYEVFGVSRSKAYESIAAGVIPSIDLAGVKRVPVDGLRELIARELAEKADGDRIRSGIRRARGAHPRAARPGAASFCLVPHSCVTDPQGVLSQYPAAGRIRVGATADHEDVSAF